MSPYIFPRQTPQVTAATTTFAQPTTTLALPTTFTPPASCGVLVQTNPVPSITQLWLDEPVPFPGSTNRACLPSEFLASYVSVAPKTLGAPASSIVPAMSPLACPATYCTAFIGQNNYIACCPEKYEFSTSTPGPIKTRPAYGGLCVSRVDVGRSVTVLSYGQKGSALQTVYLASTTGGYAYAHPIDGWASKAPTSGCATARASTTTTTTTTHSSGKNWTKTKGKKGKGKKKIGGGGIAGIVIGVLTLIGGIIGMMMVALKKSKEEKESKEEGTALMKGGEGEGQGEGAASQDDTQDFLKSGQVSTVPVTAAGDAPIGKTREVDGSDLPSTNEERVERR